MAVIQSSAYCLTKQWSVTHPGIHCWSIDAGRRNPRSVCTPRVYSQRLRGSEIKTGNRRTRIFSRCSANIESTADRVVETVSINRTVQAQIVNCVGFIKRRSICKQQFLNDVMRPRRNTNVVLYFIVLLEVCCSLLRKE